MPVINQLPISTLSLDGNGFSVQRNSPAWGYANGTGQLNPALSTLQYTYSVDGNPNTKIVDFNRLALGGITTIKVPSMLDELDPNAPKNYQVGNPNTSNIGTVVSQAYKSPTGQQYKQKGPADGRY